jgi:soluble lytic murein transglycosylase
MIRPIAITLIAAVVAVHAGAEAPGDLAGAMNALDSDSFAVAIELSPEMLGNPWLEVFRLDVRARAMMAMGDSTGAAERAVSSLRIISSGEARDHPSEAGLIDLLVEAAGPGLALPYIHTGNAGRLQPGTLLRSAYALYEAGDTAAAADLMPVAARRRPGAEDMPYLRRLVVSGAIAELPTETLSHLASASIRAGDPETADMLTEILAADAEAWWRADILRAESLVASGRKSKALSRYRSIFGSDRYPLEARKTALRRLAALQYMMKKYRDSAESYRKYGLYYPDDEEAETATDRAARLDVASGRWESAVKTWGRIADSGAETYTGREAVLAMAVVLERLGRKGEAYSLLSANLDRVTGRLRSAYLYWIVRTCGDEEKRASHSLILRGENARSFYARAMEEGTGFLDASEWQSGADISDLEASTRSDPFPGSVVPPEAHSLGAFRYLLSSGRREEASACLRRYISGLGRAERDLCVGSLYGEAREGGLESLCLEITVDHPHLFLGRNDYAEFLFPFLFGQLVDRYSAERDLPSNLVLAVMREESRFDDAVMSPAGAWGLMQVMPSTGEWIGGKLGRRDVALEDLLDPDFNIAAGCWYLRFLLDRADDSIVAALAAYNAGHGRMRSWKKRFRPSVDPLAAIEMIGPAETRQYVRRVLDSYAAYVRQADSLRPR